MARAITGTNKSDTLNGTAGDDVICGGNGRDTINGRGGNDVIFGQNGKDMVDGGEGNDELGGANGKDHATGGPGLDALRGGNGRDVLDAQDGAPGDSLDGGLGVDRRTSATSRWRVRRGKPSSATRRLDPNDCPSAPRKRPLRTR
jgi:Ca2+-binding RTX toxin-like protein